MLNINETEIVSRDDLVPPKSPQSAPQTVDWSSVLGYTINEALQDDDGADADSASSRSKDEGPAEIEFSLFAPTKDTHHVQKFILPASPPPELDLKTIIVSDPSENVQFTDKDIDAARELHRPSSYYLTPPAEDDEERLAQIRAAAVSGEHILKASGERWKGCEMPWRVIKLELVSKAPTKDKKAVQDTSVDAIHAIPILREGRKRHRPNKVLRIQLRKQRAKEEEEEKAMKNAVKRKNKKKTAETKTAVQAAVHRRTEEEDREKRVRLSRLKRARKKSKQKAEKAGASEPADDMQE